MNKTKTKTIASLAALTIIFTSTFSIQTFAAKTAPTTNSSFRIGTVGYIIKEIIVDNFLVRGIRNFITSKINEYNNEIDREELKGFKDPNEIIKNLEDIVENKSEIRVYGQEKAKEQIFDALSGVIARIDNVKRNENDIKELRGNVVYLIGSPGIGKTKMCYAIADAFLKHPERTCIFCHSESITSESDLGTQLFKTVSSKNVGIKREKNAYTGSDGIIAKEEESPMLAHVLDWCESIVIIDEYEKMKQKSAKPGTMINIGGYAIPNQTSIGNAPSYDNSADEIIRSIASTGRYKFMNKEVDCSKVLFLITTNETREELEKNFGIGGTAGGGAQRLNIIEFEYLSIEACRGIISDLAEDVTKVLTDKNGPFKLASVTFEEESLKEMANYIFEDKIMQGRARHKLEDKIYSLFSKTMGKDTNKSVTIKFVPAEENIKAYFVKN